MIQILEDAYTELLSDKPSWNEKKHKDKFDEDDLFKIIDKIDAGELSTVKKDNK